MSEQAVKPLSEVVLPSTDNICDVGAGEIVVREEDVNAVSTTVFHVHRGATLKMTIVGELHVSRALCRVVEVEGDDAVVELRFACRVPFGLTLGLDDIVRVNGHRAYCVVETRCVTEDGSRAVIRQYGIVSPLRTDVSLSMSVLGMACGRSSLRAIPELDIASPAVQVSHRVAIAKPSRQKIAYCASRGMSQEDAEQMFAEQILCPFLDQTFSV